MISKSRAAVAALFALALPVVAACEPLGQGSSEPSNTVNPDVLTSIAADPFDTHSKIDEVRSAFTRDGTFSTHTSAVDMDFVLTAYPTRATPRTHEWYPLGNKYFTFTFQAYDLRKAMRDDFDLKRKAYLERVQVTSTTDSAGGMGMMPFSLDADPLDITLDPDPLKSAKYGQMITNPKGSLEVRNMIIGDLSEDTTEIELNFKFTVWVQREAGKPGYTKKIVEEKMPIFIYKSDRPTRVLPVPLDQ